MFAPLVHQNKCDSMNLEKTQIGNMYWNNNENNNHERNWSMIVIRIDNKVSILLERRTCHDNRTLWQPEAMILLHMNMMATKTRGIFI